MNVHDEFTRRVAEDRLCAAVMKAVRENDTAALGRLGMKGFAQYAGRLSELMTECARRRLLGADDFGSIMDEDEDEDDFGAMMDEVAKPAHYAHHLVNEGGTAIQQALDRRNGVRLRVIEPEFNDGRLKGIVGEASESDSENAADNLAVQLGTFVKDMGNEFMRQNAEQRDRAGFKVTITRTGGAKCCPWCADRTGKWELANAPDGVFGCHDNCKCMVDYTNSKGTVRGRAVTHKIDDKTVTKWEFADKIPYTPPKVLTREEAAAKGGFSQPKRLTGGANGGIINDEQRSKSYNDLIARLSSLGIVNNPTSLFSERPSEELIIGRLAGGDMTEGACTSLAWAYAGNKGGVDVLDFRGGGSCDFFARTLNSQTIANFDGVISYTERNTNDFNAVTELLKKVESSKEYILITGKHTAVIKKSNKGFEYLEMQSATDNGFKPLTNAALKSRFGCKKTHKSYGYAMQASSILLDRQSLSDSDEFLSILGYINTPIDQQMKGDEGHEK